MAEPIELGRITGVFGVRGEVRLFLHNPGSHLLEGEHEVWLQAPDGTRRTVTLSARPGAGKRILGRITGIEDRDAAAALRDHRVLMDRDRLPALEDDEYYLWQLEGASVQLDGQQVGQVVDIHTDGPVEVFEIIGSDGQTTWIPSLAQFIESVDVTAAVVRLRPGALGD